jgi:hypothetical protein
VADARAHALLYPPIEDFDGDGWSTTRDGVLTIENDQGWANFLKYGYRETVQTLYIGKNVTKLRNYNLTYDAPTEDFYSSEDVLGYDKDGEPYYEIDLRSGLRPAKILVDGENIVFQVINGLLINTQNQELVLSETGIGDVVIPDGVRALTYQALGDRGLTSVKFPNTLEKIGIYAFGGCDSLKKVALPESIVELDVGAFANCSALKEVNLNQKIKEINPYTFAGCAIERITIPESVEEIHSFAFIECEQLKSIEFSIGLKRVDPSAFSRCKSLVDIKFPDGLMFLGEHAFAGCYSLQRVILPDSLKQIGNKVFRGCELSILRLPNELEFILYDKRSNEYKANPHATRDKAFDLSSVDTVIFTGSDYDFGYHAITDAKHVYFLSTPPEEVGEFLDKETVEHIYCSDQFAFQWTRSKVASWVRQKLTILPAAELHALVEEKLSATPTPLETPAPTPTPTPSATPIPTRKATPVPTATPTIEQDETDVDPLLIVFAGVLALVVAGIVIVSMKKGKKKRRRKKN